MAVAPDYPEIKPAVVPVALVENTRKVTTIFILFTAQVHHIEKFVQFLPGYDWRSPTILPYVRAISSDLPSLVPLAGNCNRDELHRERPQFFFCAECGLPIKSQQGCNECGTEGIFLFGKSPETIPHLKMIIPMEALQKVAAGENVFWRGEGRIIDEDWARQITDAFVYHPPLPPKDYFIGNAP